MVASGGWRTPGVHDLAGLDVDEHGAVGATRGSRQIVRKHLAALRVGTAEPVRADIPSPRKITSWIMRPRETLTENQDE
ncbi:hypothetical protein ACFXKC_57555 [Streptomyces sp. NPDC059340]|uniref:hypothetical protein n=1 Tax=Streptomyces sp. NPDC059340 TaxID=3346806 RepID=UPI0036A9DC89